MRQLSISMEFGKETAPTDALRELLIECDYRARKDGYKPVAMESMRADKSLTTPHMKYMMLMNCEKVDNG